MRSGAPLIRTLLLGAALALAGGCAFEPAEAERRMLADPAISARVQRALSQGDPRVPGSTAALDGRSVPGASRRTADPAQLPPILYHRVVRNPALEAEVARIFERVAASWTATPRPPVRVVLIANRSYGAFASAENVIQLNLGVLERAETEDEIAFVLGHEYSHVLLGHVAERRRNTRDMRGATAGAMNVALYGIGIANRSTPQPGGAGAAVVGVAAGARLLRALTDEVLDATWSRGQEIEADRLGLDLAISAGYAPGAFGPVFSQLAEQERDRPARSAQLRDTFRDTGGLLASMVTGNRSSPMVQLAATFGGTLAGIIMDEAVGAALAPLTDVHAGSETRQRSLTAYSDRHWADATARATPSPFRQARLQAQLAPIIRAEEAFTAGLGALAEGRIEDAERIANAPVPPQRRGARPEANELQRVAPVAWHQLNAKIAVARGDFERAARHLGQAEQLPDSSAMVYTELASALTEMRQFDSALAVLSRAEARFGTAEPFMAQRIEVLRAANREADLKAALTRCQTEMASDFARLCTEAARRPAGGGVPLVR